MNLTVQTMRPKKQKPTWQSAPRIAALAILLSAMFVAILALPDLDTDRIGKAVGHAGPIAIVLLVALGIVISPIPSGAVAVAAGAMYGTWVGGGLTVLGATLGASIAFSLSRWLGRSVVESSTSRAAKFLTRARSQNALTLAVFATRLVPFVSFDAVSYLAGLTPIAFWRFFLATLLGTAPVCIAFAAAGSSQGGASQSTAVLVMVFGITLLLPAASLMMHTIRSLPGFTTVFGRFRGKRPAWPGLSRMLWRPFQNLRMNWLRLTN